MISHGAASSQVNGQVQEGTKVLGRVTGSLLVLESLLATVPFFVLGAVFEFPDILRKGADEVLPLFAQNQGMIVPTYYVFMLSSVLLIPIALLLRRMIVGVGPSSVLLDIATAFGVTAGVTQFLGFVRWPFMIPYLAETYLDPASSPATRDAVSVVYEGFNRYAGMAIGEHLGWLFLGLWLVTVSFAMFGRLSRWLGGTALLLGVCFLVSIGEQFGGGAAPLFATANLVTNTLWSFWLIVAAIVVWRRDDTRAPSWRGR